jgi:hypothetical protein
MKTLLIYFLVYLLYVSIGTLILKWRIPDNTWISHFKIMLKGFAIAFAVVFSFLFLIA